MRADVNFCDVFLFMNSEFLLIDTDFMENVCFWFVTIVEGFLEQRHDSWEREKLTFLNEELTTKLL